MSESFTDFLGQLRERAGRPEEGSLVFEGALDPFRSDEALLFFATDPCRGPWLRIPVGAVADLRHTGETRCGPLGFPRVRVELDPEDSSTPPVVDGIAAGLRVGLPAGRGASPGAGGMSEADDGASHDVTAEIHPEGRIYRIRLQVEGHEVQGVAWDGERKLYVARIPGLVVEDALDVYLQAWGNDGASLTLTVEVDGRTLDPPLEAKVTQRPGEARRSYRL